MYDSITSNLVISHNPVEIKHKCYDILFREKLFGRVISLRGRDWGWSPMSCNLVTQWRL